MFNLSGSEIVFLLLIALIVLGPEKLPEAVRKFGKAYAEFKKMSSGFQSELKTALDEPMREMRETAEAFKKAANFDFDDEPDEDSDSTDDVADKPDTDEPAAVEPVAAEPAAVEPVADQPTPEVAGNEPPLVRPPGPTFHSAAPQQPDVVEAVEEPASE
ncbi:MAG: twin-arginine translocase subunit TatB [Ilumatobacteraceae bacterium]|nr:twin-arginine translocase subunit TatB [Ilumatobacteraceae bacterium]